MKPETQITENFMTPSNKIDNSNSNPRKNNVIFYLLTFAGIGAFFTL